MATVTTQDELRAAVAGTDPEIVVANNIDLNGTITVSRAVEIKGQAGNISLIWTGGAADMFYVDAAGRLTIESLALDGGGRDVTLVQVRDGVFTMNAGTALQNLRSTTSRSAVIIGYLPTRIPGGTFIMNGGLITNVHTGNGAVFCVGGEMFMHNDAEISGNTNAGITLQDGTTTAGVNVSATLTMTGTSRIANNDCTLNGGSGGAGIVLGSHIIMGVNPGDAPSVTGNHSIGNCGGFFMVEGVPSGVHSSLTMRYDAEISDNTADVLAGGVGARNTAFVMSENAAIKNNTGVGNVGGVLLSPVCTLVMSDMAHISGNKTEGRGGGVYIQDGSTLQMRGSSAVDGNTGNEGAGIFIASTGVAEIGPYGSSPSVQGNEAASKGGGIYIADGGRLDLSGSANISGNTAPEGKGIYDEGALHISQSAKVQDGLYIAVSLEMQDHDLPVIADSLTDSAVIQLESSDYVSPARVAFMIAQKGERPASLAETDRMAWRLPTDFAAGHAVTLNQALNQVMVDFEAFSLTFQNLHDANNPNPVSYTIADLTLVLSDPAPRAGYVFKGWFDATGKRITQIPAGTTGNLTLTAMWEDLVLSFDGNAPCACNVPEAIRADQYGKVVIPTAVPYRPCYRFLYWSIRAPDHEKILYPGDTVFVANGRATLYAQWQCGN